MSTNPHTLDPEAQLKEIQHRAFGGTGSYYPHWLKWCVYTDGVRDICQAFDCYWLLDIVASIYLEHILPDFRDGYRGSYEITFQRHPAGGGRFSARRPRVLDALKEDDLDQASGMKEIYGQDVEFTNLPVQRLDWKAAINEADDKLMLVVCLPEED